MRLQDKVAVVTGGTGGIGQAIARLFADEGARVVVADVSADAARAVAGELPNDSFGVGVDVASVPSIAAMVDEVVATAGGIDVLVNNAGVFGMEPLLEVTEEGYDRLFAVNVRGFFFVLQQVARHMVETGRRGVIVNTASQAGRRGEAHSAVYAATKATTISLSQSAALALVDKGIRVNAIAPGVVDTPMWARVDALYAEKDGIPLGEKTRQVRAAIPYGRLARPEEVARAALFLASDEAEYIVGQTLNVDGGNVLS
ncbi:sorbitol dehydrogenase [Gemmatimonadetes bacterium T265]|nr:sorbitol dehydrogenase [Gemmatimonadetes bacterium T265]